MTPISDPATPETDDRQCTVPACDHPPCFRIHLDRPAESPCTCAPITGAACAAHLVDAIHRLAQSARTQCPHPAKVTVYVADQPTEATRSAPCQGFAFTTFHVPE